MGDHCRLPLTIGMEGGTNSAVAGLAEQWRGAQRVLYVVAFLSCHECRFRFFSNGVKLLFIHGQGGSRPAQRVEKKEHEAKRHNGRVEPRGRDLIVPPNLTSQPL